VPSTPNAAEVQSALSNLEDNFLGPFESAGVKLSRNMYDSLDMPWNVKPPVVEFSEKNHLRHEWNRNGKLLPGEDDFFDGTTQHTLNELTDMLGSTSMVTNWRKANPSLVGTDQDCVEVTVKKIAKALGDEDGDRDKMSFRTGCALSLLLFSRV
jgi:trans-aconitate 3-methyltransferase